MQELMANYLGEVCNPVRFLLNLVPEDKYEWSPSDSMMKLGILVSHLADTPEVVYQAATENWPTEFGEPKPMPKADAIAKFNKLEKQAVDALRHLDPAEYGKTVKAPWGSEGTKFSMVMSMIDHIIHHKMQLFMYLKSLGQKLGSMELYYAMPSEG